jgi:hypothetical protein
MPIRTIIWTALVCAAIATAPSPVHAQVVEAVGNRALGMGGAFVAVAGDSSATWWNPAALADGPFLDLSIGTARNERDAEMPAGRDRVSGFALATPVLGVSFYRFAVAEAAHGVPIEGGAGVRQDEQTSTALRSWSASSLGATIVQTIVEGTHVGATLKYVRGTVRGGLVDSAIAPEDALDQAGDLEGGRVEGTFDLDIGALAIAGPVRLGVLVRNTLAPSFASGTFTLPRQSRLGVALSAEQVGGPPLIVSFDADLHAYEVAGRSRRVIAVGAEQWLAGKRLGLRAGARFNQVGRGERALTAGASVAVRSGSYFEAHVVGGGSPEERGWGTGVRVSF